MIPKIKVTYILSHINKALAFEWVVDNLDKNRFELNFILIGKKNTALKKYLDQKNISSYEIEFSSKKDYLKTFFKVFKILSSTKPQIVHTHLRDANLIGQSAAFILRIPKRIYTRHSATFNHEFFPKAVKYDKLVNSICTDIVSISEATTYALRDLEKVPDPKIHLIHHGFDLDKFENVEPTEIEVLKAKYIPPNKYPVIGMIARYFLFKGQGYVIPAFKRILANYPNAYLVLANTQGPDKNKIEKLLSELPQGSYTEIPFENNLYAFYKLFDCYISAPTNKYIEAFGQTYIESLAAGIPSVFTLSGIANEMAEDKINCLVVDYKNEEAIYNALSLILKDDNLKRSLITNGVTSVKSKFGLSIMIKKLEELYLN